MLSCLVRIVFETRKIVILQMVNRAMLLIVNTMFEVHHQNKVLTRCVMVLVFVNYKNWFMQNLL